VQAGLERAVVAAEPLDDARLRLRHDPNRAHDHEHDEEEQDCRHDQCCHGVCPPLQVDAEQEV
jgi:hypothetical protein